MTTPSTLEFPLRTETAFLVAATMVRGLAEEEAERERDWVGEETLKESPLKEEEVRLMGVEEKEKGGR